ncbi:hypothetical protein [Acinetobacter sp. WZC-1]|uniref:hypothetical protein n=1 Tax=Acinetobacter sp. WZC-1 TaxID=3459034 RepID=UPI00403E15F7
MRCNVTVLESTNEISKRTLALLASQPEQYSIFAISASGALEQLVEMCRVYRPRIVVVPANKQDQLQKLFRENQIKTDIMTGETGMIAVSSHSSVDIVVSALSGVAALPSCFAAVKAGKRLLLAHTDILMMAGSLLMQAAEVSRAVILPINYEYNLIKHRLLTYFNRQDKDDFQHMEISQVLLAASGGSLLYMPLSELKQVKPDDIVKKSVTRNELKQLINSSTLMDKGQELVNLSHFCALSENMLDLTIHPQHKVHSIIRISNDSNLLQAVNPDLNKSIAVALDWSIFRSFHSEESLPDLFTGAVLTFQQPAAQRFPAVQLVKSVIQSGGVSGAILNAANDVAVDAYMHSQIDYIGIVQLIEQVLNTLENKKYTDIETVIEVDREARSFSKKYIKSI